MTTANMPSGSLESCCEYCIKENIASSLLRCSSLWSVSMTNELRSKEALRGYVLLHFYYILLAIMVVCWVASRITKRAQNQTVRVIPDVFLTYIFNKGDHCQGPVTPFFSKPIALNTNKLQVSHHSMEDSFQLELLRSRKAYTGIKRFPCHEWGCSIW